MSELLIATWLMDVRLCITATLFLLTAHYYFIARALGYQP